MIRFSLATNCRQALAGALAIGMTAFLSASPAEAQELSSWKIDADQATEAYFETTDRADEARRAALRKAASVWLKTLEAELAAAQDAGDDKAVRTLTTRIEAASRAGRAPLPRPADAVAFEGHAYAFLEAGKTWHEAKAHCEAMGGRLLTIDSEAEEAFVLSKWGSRDFFVGATDLYTPGEYLTLDGEPFQGFAAPFRPDDAMGWQNAVGWYSQNRDWNDHFDAYRHPYVCEWESAE